MGPRHNQNYKPRKTSKPTACPRVDDVTSYMLAEILAVVSSAHAIGTGYEGFIRESRVPDCELTKILFENQEYKDIVKRLEELLGDIQAQEELANINWRRQSNNFREKTIWAKAVSWRDTLASQRNPPNWMDHLWNKHFGKARSWVSGQQNSSRIHQTYIDLTVMDT